MIRLMKGILQKVILAAVVMSIPGDWRVSALSVESSSSGRTQSKAFTGFASCRECHERFYKLWAPSHHGLAMQPYTAEFAGANLTLQSTDIKIGKFQYRAEIEADKGWVREVGPEGKNTYPMVHVLARSSSGKYFFDFV